jgi:hypothetical protein
VSRAHAGGRHHPQRLETMSPKNAWKMVAGFLFVFGAFVWGGNKCGPHMYKDKLLGSDNVDQTFTVRIRGMTEKHRNLDIYAAVSTLCACQLWISDLTDFHSFNRKLSALTCRAFLV